MFKINLNKKIFGLIAALVVLSNLFLSFYMYNEMQKLIETRAESRANSLKEYFSAIRYVYHQQFIKSGLEITDSTLGFLPAHASTLISEKFSQISKDKITIRNVSDRPRNQLNRADEYEQKAIEHFKENTSDTFHLEKITKEDKKYFNYTYPIVIEAYCLKCHGERENAMPSIRDRYDTAYGYEVGDIRGVTSVKIPLDELKNQTIVIYYKGMLFIWFSIIFLLTVIHYTLKSITKKDIEQKIKLEEEVNSKTAYLQKTKK